MLAIRQHEQTPSLKLTNHHPARASIGAKRNPESTRAILNAAETILRDEGLVGLSMDAIARSAHCGKPTLYRWWPDKASLLADIHARALPALTTGEALSTEEAIDHLLSQWVKAWRDTLAGIALQGMLAEAQSSETAKAVLNERGFMPYRISLEAVLERSDREVEATLRDLLAPLLGQLMLNSEATTAPQRRTRSVVYRELHQPAKPQAPEVAPVESFVHRGDWVD